VLATAALKRRLMPDVFDRRYEAIAAARKRLYKSGVGGGIAERIPQLIYGGVQSVIKIDESIGGPETLAKLFASDQIAGSLQQQDQYAKCLIPNAREWLAIFVQFTGGSVQIEQTETKPRAADVLFVHAETSEREFILCEKCG
jgi:hypothetical protein